MSAWQLSTIPRIRCFSIANASVVTSKTFIPTKSIHLKFSNSKAYFRKLLFLKSKVTCLKSVI